ncbi:hypothetical protein IMG5_192440 [Ichthyophthirius multifiliis]|uniref:Uncharacterized protein n=1 Tax=Ichthyophthirius multifiliis TaxID=5932 RepID=G0R4G5_ICHMU|nr:hypothetical protein IMG5_192440 [Ichthyophthirius multifiliis]EGR27640.1 hypothetical protein IMG5_192440 [Ichthyophthirius multifiliis]|eukprot:XP_004025092.1 hypothetical protein IMG5_192440 [Ichthyophthirius multifiliis]
MAPPPKYIITRKLVRKYFEKNLPKQPLETQAQQGLLQKCWKQYGLDDPRCKQFEALHDYLHTQTQQYREKIKNLRIKEDVMGKLNTPVYKNQKKGRFQSGEIREWNIYDGLK